VADKTRSLKSSYQQQYRSTSSLINSTVNCELVELVILVTSFRLADNRNSGPKVQFFLNSFAACGDIDQNGHEMDDFREVSGLREKVMPKNHTCGLVKGLDITSSLEIKVVTLA